MWPSSAAAVLAAALFQAAPTPTDPCQATAGTRGYTVVVDAAGHFLHCRDGEETDTQPVSGEHVDLRLPPVDPREPYRLRLVDPTRVHHPGRHRLFQGQLQTAQDFARGLQQLATAPEDLGEGRVAVSAPAAPSSTPEAPAPGGNPGKEKEPKEKESKPKDAKPKIAQIALPPAAPGAEGNVLREVETLRAQYLSIATPTFSAAIRQLVKQLPAMRLLAGEVDQACATRADTMPEGALKEAVAQRCVGGGPGKRLASAIQPVEAGLATLRSARRGAREALLELALRPAGTPDQAAAAEQARIALAKALEAAKATVDLAGPAAETIEQFTGDLRFLQIALSIPPAAVEGQRIPLGRFSAAGPFSAPVIYQLHISREPSALFDLAGSEQGEGAQAEASEVLVDRFEPVQHRYFSLEVALMYSGGLPDHPDLAGRVGQQTLVAAHTEGFSGGVLASLEPLEFRYAEYPWAGMLRFPTLIVPFTLDPLNNYFLGGGIGWNDVGSINVGVHIAGTTVPAPGTPYGTQFTTSPILLDHVTEAGPIAAGYFISASLDVLGIIHLFVSERQPTVRDVYSSGELAAP